MKTTLRSLILVLGLWPYVSARAGLADCRDWFRPRVIQQAAKRAAVKGILGSMALRRGLYKYKRQIKSAARRGTFRAYDNFGEMGLAEFGISVRFNRERLAAISDLPNDVAVLFTPNHHLGIADGLAMQHLSRLARPNAPSFLYLAHWIKSLLPFALYAPGGWGTAVPVVINWPAESDLQYQEKVKAMKQANGSWSRKVMKALKAGATGTIFMAGHVASVDKRKSYPDGVTDDENSWQDGAFALMRSTHGTGRFVLTYIDNVNSEAFYRDRKKYGGLDDERKFWFMSEAVAMRGQSVNVYLSRPMTMDELIDTLAWTFGEPAERLRDDPKVLAEFMRRYVYLIPTLDPQTLDGFDAPRMRTPAEKARAAREAAP